MTSDQLNKEIEAKFGNRLRSRVNGILIEDGLILMIKHLMFDQREFWSVPGGGMKFGSDAEENLKREYLEETGLEVEIDQYLFVHEFLDPPLHAMEHFFKVNRISGIARLGKDPELSNQNQIIQELRWMTVEDIQMLPKHSLHRVFWGIKSLDELALWKGYFNFGNNSIK
jgi:8-oxo-dGTP diphosphatase